MSDILKQLRDPSAFRPSREETADYIEKLETLIKDFFILLDKTEETDEGRVFRPNHINSCRVQDGQRLDNLLRLMKATLEDRQK